MLQFENVSFRYPGADARRLVLRDVSYTFEPGKLYAVVGVSGSGKTTLLTLAAGLDNPTDGTVKFGGRALPAIGGETYRRKHASIVFQSYNLIGYMTALENVRTALDIAGITGNHDELALRCLNQLDINREEANRRINRLSGGQQQRVALARTLACNVDVLLADEPTGNLDTETAGTIIASLAAMARQHGKCVIAVTHSDQVAQAADVVLRMRDGQLLPAAEAASN